MRDNKLEKEVRSVSPELQDPGVTQETETVSSFKSASQPSSDDEALSSSPAVHEAGDIEVTSEPTAADNRDEDKAVVAEMRQKTRRSFMVGGLAALTALGGWRWLRTRREVDGLAWPLRLAHEFNEQLSLDYFSRARLSPTFPREMASEPRVNGTEGLDDDFEPTQWKLAIVGLANPPESPAAEKSSATSGDPDAKPPTSTSSSSGASGKKGSASGDAGQESDADSESDSSDESDEPDSADSTDASDSDLLLTLEEIKRLPRVEMVTQLKCIEGWSVIVQWAGARLADLIAKYPPVTRSGDDPDVLRRPDDLVRYVSLETPNAGYYVGLDMESALHPQTLLCYEMNGEPLSLAHGAPLRLVIPLKYGIKNIKRIGRITYSDKRPSDYWAERGYDWYSGH